VHCCSQLTKILASPDVHLGIVLSQVVKPGLVNHKDSSSYDRCPRGREREEATSELEERGALSGGPRSQGHLPQIPAYSHWVRLPAASRPLPTVPTASCSLCSCSQGPRAQSGVSTRNCELSGSWRLIPTFSQAPTRLLAQEGGDPEPMALQT
jgi:hypothetical protein